MKKINSELLNKLCEESRNIPRRRKNYNFHEELSDTLQRLLNAIQPGTYFQPHKHEDPDKREAFILLRGKAVVITFNNKGDIRDHILLDPLTENFGAEIPERTWHTIIVLKKDSVIYEVKDGPYSPIDDKNFAPWAPKEGDTDCNEYNQSLLKQLDISI